MKGDPPAVQERTGLGWILSCVGVGGRNGDLTLTERTPTRRWVALDGCYSLRGACFSSNRRFRSFRHDNHISDTKDVGNP